MAARPKGVPHHVAPHLAGKSFPHPPLIQFSTEPATAWPSTPARLRCSRSLPITRDWKLRRMKAQAHRRDGAGTRSSVQPP